MSEARSDLIYDVGLFQGEDTAYYLFRGYNVVAIDANPLMIERAKLRFSKEILAKQLTLLNVGISRTSGTATFWISDLPEWSSFDRTIASRDGVAHRSISVSTVPFSQLLAEYGVPHYLKIDIEGNDALCVEALRRTKIPKYVSVESECVGDTAVLSDKEAVAMLKLLRDVGYQRFKLVDQRNKLGSKLGFAFSPDSSGPWGDDIPGGWMGFEKAKSLYLRKRHSFFSQERALYSFWNDWHATY
jgi:FkbM family methyltransferase